MRKVYTSVAVILAMALPVFAASKQQGTMTLKDFQPAGTQQKGQKHQAYDLSFDAATKRYTCRTDSDKSTNATDFVVGETMNYEIDGQKVKIKTPEGKQVECKIVRMEVIPPTSGVPTAAPGTSTAPRQ
jgi:hypothetical protein